MKRLVLGSVMATVGMLGCGETHEHETDMEPEEGLDPQAPYCQYQDITSCAWNGFGNACVIVTSNVVHGLPCNDVHTKKVCMADHLLSKCYVTNSNGEYTTCVKK